MINLAKFTHGKCCTLIMTGLAAGPEHLAAGQRGQLQLPGQGQALPAPRGSCGLGWRESGTAYFLVAPYEVPNLLDLHLFLGCALICPRPKEPSGVMGMDGAGPGATEPGGRGALRPAEIPGGVAGAVGPGCMASNTQQQCVHLQLKPSPESNTEPSALPLQLQLRGGAGGQHQAVPLAMTIFEINASSRDLSSQVMQAK
uniref:Uncharacterized protein n=1 Tax=Pipistrellus kuhlii TaxID=59472 RepID=A0A7J7UAB9_PIPKU|nr:hypothetical protein mPipKuh1_009146 [Pipistrellus kuhlii]